MKKFILISFIFATILSSSCSDSKNCKCTIPPNKAKPGTAVKLANIIDNGNTPGLERVWKRKVNSAKDGYDGLKAIFPKYGKRVECFTKTKGFFFFSIRPEENEDDGAPNCSYSLVIYVKKGENTFRYFWTKKL